MPVGSCCRTVALGFVKWADLVGLAGRGAGGGEVGRHELLPAGRGDVVVDVLLRERRELREVHVEPGRLLGGLPGDLADHGAVERLEHRVPGHRDVVRHVLQVAQEVAEVHEVERADARVDAFTNSSASERARPTSGAISSMCADAASANDWMAASSRDIWSLSTHRRRGEGAPALGVLVGVGAVRLVVDPAPLGAGHVLAERLDRVRAQGRGTEGDLLRAREGPGQRRRVPRPPRSWTSGRRRGRSRRTGRCRRPACRR